MRILQVHTRYREPGGEDVVVADERGLLQAAGHEVYEFVAENPTRTSRIGPCSRPFVMEPPTSQRRGVCCPACAARFGACSQHLVRHVAIGIGGARPHRSADRRERPQFPACVCQWPLASGRSCMRGLCWISPGARGRSPVLPRLPRTLRRCCHLHRHPKIRPHLGPLRRPIHGIERVRALQARRPVTVRTRRRPRELQRRSWSATVTPVSIEHDHVHRAPFGREGPGHAPRCLGAARARKVGAGRGRRWSDTGRARTAAAHPVSDSSARYLTMRQSLAYSRLVDWFSPHAAMRPDFLASLSKRLQQGCPWS